MLHLSLNDGQVRQTISRVRRTLSRAINAGFNGSRFCFSFASPQPVGRGQVGADWVLPLLAGIPCLREVINYSIALHIRCLSSRSYNYFDDDVGKRKGRRPPAQTSPHGTSKLQKR